MIDTHTHFYDPAWPQGVPWPPRDDRLLYRRVLPADYRALPVARPVTGTVVVEASPWVEDNQWVLDLAAREPFIVGFVGNLPVGTREFAGHLKRFSANKIFRGIRVGARKAAETRPNAPFSRDLHLLAEHNLSLDLLGGVEILPFADGLAREIPPLRIIIDHLAGVLLDGKAPPADWLKQMRTVAARPNLYCKISGLVEGTGRSDGSAPRDAEFYAPVLNAMTEIFGPRAFDLRQQLASGRTVRATGHGARNCEGLFSALRVPGRPWRAKRPLSCSSRSVGLVPTFLPSWLALRDAPYPLMPLTGRTLLSSPSCITIA